MAVLSRLACLLVLVLGLAHTLALPVAAQESTQIDSVKWERIAKQVEAAISNEDTTVERLDTLRQEVVAFRSAFDTARGQNAGRLATLRGQIVALGIPPEGENAQSEASGVIAERKRLNARLQSLLAPIQKAEASFLLAESLVARIDTVQRARQTRKLLSSSPSPLNPANWPTALADLRKTASKIAQETRDARKKASGRELRRNLPFAVIAAVLGFVLIVRGRVWSSKLVNWLRNYSTRAFGVWRFVLSLLRVVLPLVGIALLLIALLSTELLGQGMKELTIVLAIIASFMLGFRWVSEQVFARDEDVALLSLKPEQRRSARFYVSVITFMIVCGGLIEGFLQTGITAPATLPVAEFPFFVGISFALFKLGRILRDYQDAAPSEDGEMTARASTLSRMVRWFGLGAMIIAIAAPLLMVLGYYDLADAMQRPYVLTLIVLGLVMALQRFSADLYGAFTGEGVAAREALLPVLFGFILILLSLPWLALIWGARLTDLSELWSKFRQGFTIGESTISPTDFLSFALIFATCYILTRLVQGALRSNVLPKTKIDIGGQNAIVSGVGYVGIFLAALAAITGAGIDLSSLAIVAGALSVGIGFGLQNIVSNFVSGIILLIERPISEGDWIEVTGGQMGYVRDISVRSTRIETFDRTDVIVPNADLVSGTVINYTRGNTVGRVIVPVGVAYGTDTKRVDAILREIAEAQPMVLAHPPANVFLISFGADALEFEIRCFLRDVNWTMVVKSDINHAIAERFAAEGIEIPFAQRDLWLRNPESLQPGPTSKAPKTLPKKGVT